jgi:putative adenylate-forming enzyme
MMFKLKVIFFWIKFSLQKNFQNQAEIEVFQDKKLIKFAQKVLSKSFFYKKYFKQGKLNFQDIPIISKTNFIEHFDEINTVNISKEDALKTAIDAETSRNFKSEINGITVGLSTGTSGKRGIFLASENERAKWAALVMQRVIRPVFFKKQRIAFFLRANSNLYASISSGLFEFKYFDIFRPIDDLIQELNAFQPHILAAQPSILVDIALAQSKSEIDLNLTQVISFAEVLHLDDKSFIKSQFACKFTEVYQCTEGFLGVSCSHGTMHLNEDFVKIEKDVIDGERFYPIITDFSRGSQPVVKYRLDDVLVAKQTPCGCGSKLMAIETIVGRDDDILEFISDKKTIKIYPDLIARRIALVSDSFYKYQITQLSYHKLEISIEAENFEELSKIFRKTLENLLQERNIEGIAFTFKNSVEIVAGNKLRKIQKAFE